MRPQIFRIRLNRSISKLAPLVFAVVGCIFFAFSKSSSSQELNQAKPVLQAGDRASKSESDADRVLELFHAGKFDEATTLANSLDTALGEFSADERWPIITLRSQMARGKYAEALQTLNELLERFPNSIRLRRVGIDICRYNNDAKRAAELSSEIFELAREDGWRFRDVENQIVLAQLFLMQRADAKQVIVRILEPNKNKNPNHPDIYAAIGQLALDKNDFALAAENFFKATALQPNDPDLFFGLAQCYLPSDSEKASAAVEQALRLNPDHVESLLLIVDQHLSAENYADAKKTLDQILAVNPEQPIAWAYRAVLAHLNNNPGDEGRFRNRALQHWPGNPEVDHTIGRELSQKYRFAESVPYQRRALVYDAHYLPAKMQLAHDLLRLGQELEGWLLADEIFDADQYSVVALNLVTLRENLAKFRTLEGDGFVVRMETEESYIYGPRVLELLTQAKQKLCEKYAVELETPIFIEIFPRQQDFAIRTFGLPGGNGFLGVCFGRLVTMNSPAAQGANLTSWESVLWHEFCHVVTLQKTNNRMPRWLSEGISVYEERLADPAWGENINPKYREMMLGDELIPISKLSGAFLNPPSPAHLQFAYYESSLVVEYLVNEFGLESLLKVLDELAIGMPINNALTRHVAPEEFLDKKFAEFARQRAHEFAADANWDEPDLPADASTEQWQQWNDQHPRNVAGLVKLATKLIEDKNYESSLKPLSEILQIDSRASGSAYVLLAKAHRELGEQVKEKEALDQLIEIDADSVEPLDRLLEISSTAGQWQQTKIYARRLIALNPLIPLPHRYLSIAAEKTNDDLATIESLSVLARMNPLDVADVQYRLASAYFRRTELPPAKRHVLMALEQAPRYQDAHQLLLKIKEQESASNTDSRAPEIQSPASSAEEKASDATISNSEAVK